MGLICIVCPIFCACTVLAGADVTLVGAKGKGCKDIPVILATVVDEGCDILVVFDVLAVVATIRDTALRFDKEVTV